MTRCTCLHPRLFIPLIVLILSGCQSGVYLMPTPVAMQSGKHDPFSDTPDREQVSEITVAYGTNRLPSDAGAHYAREFDQNLRMGIVRVKIGDGDQSWEDIRQLSIHGLDKKDALLTISEVQQLGEMDADDSLDKLPPELQSMIDKLNEVIDQSLVKELTIYVHGANNSFYRTSAQAAQYRHFTGRHAIVTLFSWPSAESILRYGTDVSNILETVPTFARYIKLIARHTTAGRINILCYHIIQRCLFDHDHE
jgi:esterase/lipase superfamily enzyme